MAIVFITGSTDGLGRAAAQSLLEQGHQVVLHARSAERATAISELESHSARVVIGDLKSAAQTRHVADQVNAIGRMDAVIHNAGSIPSAAAARRPKATPPPWQSTRSRPICSPP